MAHKLHIIIASTRPGRVGPKVANWIFEYAKEHGKFEPVLVDLADFNLPVYDEPHHPRLQQYQHEHTKAWSASVNAADAFLFVTPEYNYFAPPALVNAFSYVFKEWKYKPAGLVSYGGVSGGLRAAQSEKLLMTTLGVVPLAEGVAIPMVGQLINAEGQLVPNDLIIASAKGMLDELIKWSEALKPLRSA
ncbi:NAD(P)H-dependent oxidoreductase [Kaistia dalseonensis]|uniref:NAD(P)H-dependent FMN reductase n=1 Tax=Kaistia dalseonensis TaxID=410840 RepID=A0ABU0H0I1_9HYPH|nr:NAD(P)H-dependent oxidoreductase [Kaistia dalseonensis]MCX5493227.1 NAD(P)H-dependent oxidoreductase [Kaistia dalseonensis]MDQ0435782.1 NAD(P)H-dependent FMN reductase [Kaistia dalseonensis]